MAAFVYGLFAGSAVAALGSLLATVHRYGPLAASLSGHMRHFSGVHGSLRTLLPAATGLHVRLIASSGARTSGVRPSPGAWRAAA